MFPHRRPHWSAGMRFPWPALAALVVLSFLFLFWIGFAVGAALGRLTGPGLVPDRTPAAPGQPGLPGPPAVPGGVLLPVRTAARTLLTYVTSYSGCGCTETESRSAGEELADLEERELAESAPGWSLVSFTATVAELHRVLPGLCPEKTQYRTLGVQDGRIAVFFGRPSTGLLLQKVTGIPLDSLAEADRRRLTAGIVVRGDQAVERYLEGLPD